MSKLQRLVGLAAVGLAAAAASSRAAAAAPERVNAGPQDFFGGAQTNDGGATWSELDLDQVPAAAVDPRANERAFLAAIAWAEGTDRAAEPYRVCYGYRHTIRSLAEHPAVSGEWQGERLTDAQCAGAGFGPGCVSTAAGRYQINRPTWLDCKRGAGLRDFTAPSQDRAALWLIEREAALRDVQEGRFASAVQKVRRRWASLPGAGYAGQRTRTLEQIAAVYTGAGGTLA